MKREVLFKNSWLSTVLLNGWYVATEETRTINDNLVAVMPWRLFDNQRLILARREENLAHYGEKKFPLGTITGGCEKYLDIKKHAQEELMEEGGYRIPLKRFRKHGICYPLKSSKAKMHLYSVQIFPSETRKRSTGDGSIGEEDSSCQWITGDQFLRTKDPYGHTIFMRVFY